ncbi:catechol dioxygenase [Trichoderma arundinaceum]|uniref:Catechol dioxygenase n=1 Tax=Trichoderma arundinaceum TaxID=490622 RepID=A0A395NZ82_TRIAR|nr:catechol dioxygenase [Trichoderma arundinaceum]
MLSSNDKAVGVRKRDRYIAYACNRCRTAKVRCNGKLPCSYCIARDPASCRYRNPRAVDETSQQEQALQQVQRAESSSNFSIQATNDKGIGSTGYDNLRMLLQHQNHKLDTILERVSNIETGQRVQQDGNIGSPGNVQLECEEPLPVIQSSTSAFFCIHIIDANFKRLEESAETTLPQKDRKASSPSSFSILHDQIFDEIAADIGEWDDGESGMKPPNPSAVLQNVSTYPLDNLEVAEIIRLVQKYHDTVGIMYPVADVTGMLDLIENADTVDNRNDVYSRGGSLCLRRGEETILQMMVAIALAAENENGSYLIQSLHDNVLPDAQHMVWSTKTDLQGLVLLALVVRVD